MLYRRKKTHAHRSQSMVMIMKFSALWGCCSQVSELLSYSRWVNKDTCLLLIKKEKKANVRFFRFVITIIAIKINGTNQGNIGLDTFFRFDFIIDVAPLSL